MRTFVDWIEITKHCSYWSGTHRLSNRFDAISTWVIRSIHCTQFQFPIQCSCQWHRRTMIDTDVRLGTGNSRTRYSEINQNSMLIQFTSKTFELLDASVHNFIACDHICSTKEFKISQLFPVEWVRTRITNFKWSKMMNEIDVSLKIFIIEPIFRPKKITQPSQFVHTTQFSTKKKPKHRRFHVSCISLAGFFSHHNIFFVL